MLRPSQPKGRKRQRNRMRNQVRRETPAKTCSTSIRLQEIDSPRLGGIDPEKEDCVFTVELPDDSYRGKRISLAGGIPGVASSEPNLSIWEQTVVRRVLSSEIDGQVAITESIGRRRWIVVGIITAIYSRRCTRSKRGAGSRFARKAERSEMGGAAHRSRLRICPRSSYEAQVFGRCSGRWCQPPPMALAGPTLPVPAPIKFSYCPERVPFDITPLSSTRRPDDPIPTKACGGMGGVLPGGF